MKKKHLIKIILRRLFSVTYSRRGMVRKEPLIMELF